MATTLDLRVPLTEEERALLVHAGVHLDDGKVLLLENPDLFLAHYLRHRLKAFKDFHLRLIWTATHCVQGLILFPAAHGKTTIVSTGLPIWQACRNPNNRTGIIAKNEADGKSIMRAVQAEMTDNPQLIRDFGPFKKKGNVWAAEQINVAHRTLIHPRPSIQVYGSGGNVFGHRTDWTICDDVVTNKNSVTPEMRATVREWFDLGVATMAEEEDDRLTVVGTRFHPEDLYGDLIELEDDETGEKIYHVQHEDAVVDEEERVTLWPERWPWTRLMQKKSSVGTLEFNKRYRNIAVDPSRLYFREEYVKGGQLGKERYPGCLDRTLSIGDIDPGWLKYGGVDPAVGKKRGHSWPVFTVIMVGNCDQHERCFWVVDQVRETMPVTRQADVTLELHEKYGCLVTKVETNAYQEGLRDVIEERMQQRGVRYRIEPHETRSNKTDPEIGVQAMSPYFEKGYFHIPWATPADRRRMQQLIDELVNYPAHRTSDCVMSLWIAWLNAKDSAPRFRSFNRLTKPIQIGRQQLTFGRRFVQNPYYEE